MIEIPLRPDNDSEYGNLSEIEKNIIVEAVLLRLDNAVAYLRFTPEYAVAQKRADAKGFSKYYINKTGKDQSKQFWGLAKVQEFRDDYERTVDEFFGRNKRVGSSADLSEELSEERKDSALKSLLNKALALVEKGGEIDPDTLKTIADLFKRLGVLKDEVEEQEKPRRYLPLRCRQECQYRFFVEKHVETCEIVSDCEYCKALAIAKEHGYHYDPTTNLSIPEETETPKENNLE